MTHRVVPLLVLGFLLAMMACGTDEGGGASHSSGEADEADIRRLFSEYKSALDDHRYSGVCSMNTQQFNETMVSEIRDTFARSRHLPSTLKDRPVTCALALRVMATGNRPSEQSLRNVEVSGDRARGRVGPSTWKFAREDGEWRVEYAN